MKLYKKEIGSFWMIVASIGFALMGFFVKLSSQFFDYQEIVFWRMVIAVVILLLFARVRHQSIKTTYLRSHIMRGVAGTIALVLYFYLITHLPLATAVTLSYTSVIWFIIFSFLILKQKISISVLLCAVIGFIGIILLLEPTFSKGEILNTFIGILTGAISALAYIQVKELTLLKEPEWRIVFYFSLIGAIVTGIWSLISGFHIITLNNCVLILVMGFFALLGQICLTLAYSKGNLFISSMLSYVTIVFSFLLGFFVLGDHLTVKEGMGIFLIIASGIFSSILNDLQKRKKQQAISNRTLNHS